MKVNQIGTELRGKVLQKDLARALDVTPRTLRNWDKKSGLESFKKLGRPAHDERARRAAYWRVGREYLRQGRCGWRPIAFALSGEVPTRLIQAVTRDLKSYEKKHERRRILPRRQRIDVLVKNALWVQDGSQVGREENGKAIESQIVKDRGSLITVGIATGASARGADVIDLLSRLKAERGLPLVLGSDNGSQYVCEETKAYLRQEKVIHLRSLPRTPQHNGAAEIGHAEIKRCAGLKACLVTTPEIAHDKAVRAIQLLDKNRFRQSKGFKTGAELDETLFVGYDKISRDWFYEECSKRIEEAKLGKSTWREKRMAERDAIFETMERYGLVRRHGGGSNAVAKEEINL